ncbi:MAG: Vitamin B12 dependent methionine synthase activation subunit [Firmicutes bacterium]|nr:Vitamin B12 dependent methionine synthase activation subunit [Bacillota bacterium]
MYAKFWEEQAENLSGDHPLIKETLRYLGYSSSQAETADERTLEVVIECAGELARRCRPRHISRRIPVKAAGGSRTELEGGFVWESESLGRALGGCSEVLIFGATLGVEADMLIGRFARRDISRAAIMAAAATAFTEDYCDWACRRLEEELQQQGHTLGERFSPGYGDFSLEYQGDIFRILDCPKNIGVTLTDEFIMIPSKSVTAVMAIDGYCGKQLGCRYCSKADCLYRRK